jgi:crossover junction endodeoxyribonuclease RuvC
MSAVCGIDPGLSGGLALVGKDGLIVEPMPCYDAKKGKTSKRYLDLPKLAEWFKAHQGEIRIVFIEQPGYRPGQAVQSGATVGRNFGVIEGMLAALEIPYQIVTPQSWMKQMHAGLPTMDTKARSVIAASRLFPGVDFRASERSRNPHEGMVEACLIAEYGRRSVGNA